MTGLIGSIDVAMFALDVPDARVALVGPGNLAKTGEDDDDVRERNLSRLISVSTYKKHLLLVRYPSKGRTVCVSMDHRVVALVLLCNTQMRILFLCEI